MSPGRSSRWPRCSWSARCTRATACAGGADRHGRRARRHGPAGARAAHQRRLRRGRGHPRPPPGAGAAASRRRGAGPGGCGLLRQDRHPDRRQHHVRPLSSGSTTQAPSRRGARRARRRGGPERHAGRRSGRRFPPPAGWARESAVPFSSARKWSAASFAGHGTWVLGAPEVVLAAAPPGGPGPGRHARRRAGAGSSCWPGPRGSAGQRVAPAGPAAGARSSCSPSS